MLKLYVLIRDDIGPAQQAVQAGHAIAQFGLDHPKEFKNWQENGNTLIYLSVSNIFKWIDTMTDSEFKHSVFREPDVHSLGADFVYRYGTPSMVIPTAIAVAPNWTCQYLLFKDLPLASFGTRPPTQSAETSAPKTKRFWNR